MLLKLWRKVTRDKTFHIPCKVLRLLTKGISGNRPWQKAKELRRKWVYRSSRQQLIRLSVRYLRYLRISPSELKKLYEKRCRSIIVNKETDKEAKLSTNLTTQLDLEKTKKRAKKLLLRDTDYSVKVLLGCWKEIF